MDDFYYVYRWKNIDNGKSYVGKGAGDRAYQHEYAARKKPTKHDKLFVRAIRKHGIARFELTILFDGLTEDEAFRIEKIYIRNFKTNISEHGSQAGYNCTEGGEGTSGHRHTIASKKKISLGTKGKCGRPKGSTLTEEHKALLSIINSGENNSFFGKNHTYETCEHLKEMWQLRKSDAVKHAEQNADEICRLYITGEYSQYKLADIYFVSRSKIRTIIMEVNEQCLVFSGGPRRTQR